MTSNIGKVALKGDRNDLISVTELLLTQWFTDWG